MKRHRVLVLALLSLLMACSGKFCGESYLAQLDAHQGEVQRDLAASVNAWGDVSNGDRFRLGDGLRTGKDGNAQLDLGSDGVALVEGNTVLRFLDRDPRGGKRMSLEQGIVRINAGEFELDVHTPRALARIEKGASIRIVAAANENRFDVVVGKVSIDSDGITKELSQGESFTLESLTAKPSVDGEDAGASTKQTGATAANTAKQTGLPEATDVALPEADSLTLHSPSLPVVFRLAPPACADALTVELDGRATTQNVNDAAGMSLRVNTPGAHRMRVRCGKRVVRESVLRVMRDAANMELPKSAQRIDVEADGRRYTVRYQNVMPMVTIHWSDARPAPSYKLMLRRGKKEQSYESAKPTREIPGNDLIEGNYDFWYASNSGQESRVGSLRIEFDNTARSLSLSEPIDGAAADGDQVLVSGVALLRSQVSANGVPLPLDPKGRFHAQVPLTAEKTILVRADHPAAGVHYYLRRLH